MSLLHRVGCGLGTLALVVVSCAGCNEAKQEDLITKSAKIYEAGNKAQKAGNYQEAIATFSQLITTDPEETVLVDNNKEDYYYYTWALYARGKAKMDSGATDDAIRDFSYLIHWQPSNVDALIQRGMAYRLKKLLDVALRDLSDAIRARPDDKLAYLQRAIVHLELKNYDNAISDGMQAIRLQPKNAEAYRVRGEAYLAREDYPHAIDNLEMCLAQGGPPETIKALLSKARDEQQKELLAANQRAGGAQLAAQAPQLAPNIPVPGPNAQRQLRLKPPIPDPPVDDKEVDALVKTGDELSKNKDYRGAVKAYTEAIGKAPKRAELYEKRAANLLAYNFADRAQSDIETAIRLDGNTPERSRLKAWILLGVHDSYTVPVR